MRVREIEWNSIRPFGKHTRKGGFKFNIDMVPFYNIPSLEGFTLKPYVSYLTGMIPDDIWVNK